MGDSCRHVIDDAKYYCDSTGDAVGEDKEPLPKLHCNGIMSPGGGTCQPHKPEGTACDPVAVTQPSYLQCNDGLTCHKPVSQKFITSFSSGFVCMSSLTIKNDISLSTTTAT